MSDYRKPLPSEPAARAILADLRRRVLSTHAERLMETFDALVTLDACCIEQRAQAFLATLDLADLDAGVIANADPGHRASMETFRGSLFDYLEEKCPAVEPSVEHDIPTWIEANAPLVAMANLRLMEAALPHDDPQAHRSLIDLHRRLDPMRCEAQQTRVLLDAWAAIDAALRVRLALSQPD